MATALAAPDLTLIVDRASVLASTRAVRSAEWIIFVFLVCAPTLTLFVSTPPGRWTRLAPLAVILVYARLVSLDRVKPAFRLAVIRDWLPLGIILLAYREMGWSAPPSCTTSLE